MCFTFVNGKCNDLLHRLQKEYYAYECDLMCLSLIIGQNDSLRQLQKGRFSTSPKRIPFSLDPDRRVSVSDHDMHDKEMPETRPGVKTNSDPAYMSTLYKGSNR